MVQMHHSGGAGVGDGGAGGPVCGPGEPPGGSVVAVMTTDDARIRVLVVEDHEMVATALARSLTAEPDVDVVGIESELAGAMSALEGHRVDVVLLDLHLASTDDTSSAIPQLRAVRPGVRVVILTGDLDPRAVTKALAHGCDGFLIKTQPMKELLAGIRAVVDGELVVPPEQDGRVLDRIRPDGSSASVAPVDPVLAERVGSLSARELEVLGHLAAGRGTREVAETMYLSVNTIRNHVQNAMEKLDAHSRLEAVSIAVRAGVISLGG